jgi:hypothetical protein
MNCDTARAFQVFTAFAGGPETDDKLLNGNIKAINDSDERN